MVSIFAPYRERNLIFIYLLISSLILLATVVQTFRERDSAVAGAKKEVRNYLSIVEQMLIATIDKIDVTLVDIAKEIENDPKLLHSYGLKDLQSRRDRFGSGSSVELHIINADGHSILSTNEARSFVANDRSYFIEVKNNPDAPLFISEPFPGRARNSIVVAFSRRISDKKGNFLGVVVAGLGSSIFERYQSALDLGPRSFFTVVTGKEPRFVYRSKDNAQFAGRPFTHNAISNPIVEGKVHNLFSEVMSVNDDVRRYLAASWVGEYHMMAFLGQDVELTLRPWRLDALRQVLLVFFALVIGFFAVVAYARSIEKAVARQEQMASSAKFVALGEMSAAMAHEINNPLSIIYALSEKLSRLVDSRSTSWQSYGDTISKMSATIDRITAIIAALKKFSRKESGDHRPIPITTVMQDAFTLCTERFRAHGIDFSLVQFDREIYVNGSHIQLVQVLLNILNNAFDAIENLEEKWLKILGYVDDGKAIILITDSGHGIPADVAQNMMNPFYTTKELGRGTGLGLSISLGIIESHRGSLTYIPGEHTQFEIRLPVLEILEKQNAPS